MWRRHSNTRPSFAVLENCDTAEILLLRLSD
jgi:hypothetical protein